MIGKRLAMAGALCTFTVTAGVASATPQRLMQPPARKAPPIYLRIRRASATPAKYALVDDGAPTSSAYALGLAESFNNTGQIAGNAYYLASGNFSGPCVLFDGTKYRELTPSATMLGCAVNGMNDENAATGALDVIGYGTTAFSNPAGGYYGDEKSVFSTIVPKTGSIKTTVYPNDQSYLVGVNSAGTALGIGVYQPKTGFATLAPPFVARAGNSTLSVAQPACTTVRLGCAGFPNFPSGTPSACSFGGCQITNDGKLFLIDLFTGSYELVAPDGTTQDIPLAANVLPSYSDIGAPVINNAGQLLYIVQTVVAGVQVLAPQIYAIGTGKVTTVPPIAGNGCTQYLPLSFSNTGEVLGIAYNCGAGNPTYFTYDGANGTQDLGAVLPTSGYYGLDPTGVNDKGQILVTFQVTNGGQTHWGLLSPLAAKSKMAKVRHYSIARASIVAPAAQAAVAPARRFATLVTLPSGSGRALQQPGRMSRASRPLVVRPRSPRTSTPAYRIVDFGAPPATNYSLASPIAFNDTGQIVGIANDLPYKQSSTCILFDGARFRNISASPTVVDCSPMSINDKNAATGSLQVVGNIVTAFSYGSGGYEDGEYLSDIKAFSTRIVPATGVVNTSIFTSNDTSDLTSVNASGLAIGVGYYALNPNYSEPTFSLPPGTNSLRLVQPSCSAISPTCQGYNNQQPCAFGGCSLTADGTIFLNDVIIAPDGTAQAFRAPGDEPYLPIINNAKQLLYRVSGNVGSSDTFVRLYQIGAAHAAAIPKIAGNTCDGYYDPLSFNNAGTVIGMVRDCSKPADDTYFIYDATNGTRDLMALLPASGAAIAPIGINDNGQILISLTGSNGAIHWGILQPAAANARSRAVARTRIF